MLKHLLEEFVRLYFGSVRFCSVWLHGSIGEPQLHFNILQDPLREMFAVNTFSVALSIPVHNNSIYAP